MIGKLLKLSKIDIAIYIAVGLLVLVLVTMVLKWKHDSGVLKVERATHKAAIRAKDAELGQAAATIETLKVDAALNRETSNALLERLDNIEPARALSVRCIPAASPAMPAEGRATTGVDGAAIGPSPSPALRDIGPALEAARIEAQTNNAKLLTLQEFEAKRTH